MDSRKFRCNICEKDFAYQTDLLKHINAHRLVPPSACRVPVITHTSAFQSSSTTESESSGEHSGAATLLSGMLLAPNTSEKKSTSPKNGHQTSEPSTSKKNPGNIVVLSPKKHPSAPGGTDTTPKTKSKTSKRGKNSPKVIQPPDILPNKYAVEPSAGECSKDLPLFKEEFFCQFCQLPFESRPALESHFETTHKVDTPYKCLLCSREYQRESMLRYHEDHSHGKSLIFRCVKCLSRFLTEAGVRRHRCHPKPGQETTADRTHPGSGSSGGGN